MNKEQIENLKSDLASFLANPCEISNVEALLKADIEGEMNAAIQAVETLERRFAGLDRDVVSNDARRRLHHPELKTSYLNSTTRGLLAKMTAERDVLCELVPKVVRSMLRYTTFKSRLSDAIAFAEALAVEKGERKRTGLYYGTRAAVDYLFEAHHINHGHWKCSSKGQLDRIAAILGERPDESTDANDA